MGEIVEKLADSLSMFWQSLSLEERRLVLVGVVWVGLSVYSLTAGRRRQERERAQLADLVAERVNRG